jgi:uncharacterized protein YcbK (DUF882 family)
MPPFNTPDIFSFIQTILCLGLRFRFSVTSWLRSQERNKAVGGSRDSNHMTALAVDVVLDGGEDTISFKLQANKLGLKVLDEGDHLHLQPL